MKRTKLQDWAFSQSVTRSLLEYLCCASSTLHRLYLIVLESFEWKLREKHFLISKRTTLTVEFGKEPGKLQGDPLLAFEQTLKATTNVYFFGVSLQICINRVVAKKFVCRLAEKLSRLKKAQNAICRRQSQRRGRYGRGGMGGLPQESLKILIQFGALW